ncbi:MAG TPA: NAD(P)/FAD-dependent oxidoreductase [Candidatus Olsenella avicola]|nr:NAD(P)/FAD-dependent oxidoreductase [Candidatus Olsenella avicola]
MTRATAGGNCYDVVIVGAGVSGCAIARELSRYHMSACVLEAEEDVCCGTSKANSAIVHAGFDAATGTLMARLNVEGSNLMGTLCEELSVDYERIGSLVVCTDEAERGGLEALLARGRANGVTDLRIVERDELRALEPNVSEAAVAALWAPTGAIVNPFQLTLALAETAAVNGVEFRFLSPVSGVTRRPNGLWELATAAGPVRARVVVNAAGVHADELHDLVCAPDGRLEIAPRRGQYHVLDVTAGAHVRHTVFALPTRLGKGVLVTPTTGGNLLVGPTAEDIDDKRGVDTTAHGLAEVVRKAALTVRGVPFSERIRTFAGLRAHQPGHDFVIGEVPGAPGFVDCAAIESPGLSAAPAIGRMVAGIVCELLGGPAEKDGLLPRPAPVPDVARLGPEEWSALVAQRPAYGRVVCRCRTVTEGQVEDAIRRPLGARSLDGVKRRVEAGMGRCQGGFCSPRVAQVLARELGIDLRTVTLAGPGSELAAGRVKDAWAAAAEEVAR